VIIADETGLILAAKSLDDDVVGDTRRDDTRNENVRIENGSPVLGNWS
jgi:hypothetical protein